MTDLELLEGLRQRDPDVVARLLERYGNEIQAVAQLILRDRSEAEDVLIETMVTAWQRGAGMRDPGSLRAWLLRVATNHSLSLRRRLTRPLRHARWLPQPNTAPDHAAATEDRLALLAEVDRPPARMRAALVLHYYADLPVDQVARVLGRSPNTVKAQLRVALDRLRSQMGD